MKNFMCSIFVLAAIICMSNSTFGQKYDASTGNTFYSNGTVYVSLAKGDSGRNSPVVITHDSQGNFKEQADCKDSPARCKELLEEAADAEPETAEGEEEKEETKKGEGFMAEPDNVEDWQDLFNQMRKGRTGPIFFPSGGGPGGPITMSPPQWTNQIIRTLR